MPELHPVPKMVFTADIGYESAKSRGRKKS